LLLTDIGRLADLSGNFDMLWLHADLRYNRSDMHRMADLHRYGDLQQDADLQCTRHHLRSVTDLLLDRNVPGLTDLRESANL
jgi:hypothetical protein